MAKEILLVAEAVANEKGVSKAVIFDAIEAALASAARKKHDLDIDARVSIDQNTGEYETFRVWHVVDDEEEIEFPEQQITVTEAHKHDAGLNVGDRIEEMIENPGFGRIAAQAAKQVIVQKVREAEREQVYEEYAERAGELISGIVKRFDRGSVILDLGGNAEAFIPSRHMIPGESVRPGDRLRALPVRGEAGSAWSAVVCQSLHQ